MEFHWFTLDHMGSKSGLHMIAHVDGLVSLSVLKPQADKHGR